jgi:hypothetical protein
MEQFFYLKPAVGMAAKRHQRHKIKGFLKGRHGDRFHLTEKVKSPLRAFSKIP